MSATASRTVALGSIGDGRLGDRVPRHRERMVALDPRQQTTRRHPSERRSGLATAHDDRVHAMPAYRRKHMAKRRVLDEARTPGLMTSRTGVSR